MQDKITEAKHVLINLVYSDWINNDLFSPTWIGTVIFILFSYILCFKLLDKRRLRHILLFGSLITIMISLFDILGVEYVRWTYLTRIFPIMPSLFLFDFTIVPLYFMLIYQYTKKWISFTICNFVFSAILTFAFFPILISLKMFQLNNWKLIYFLPCLFTFGMASRGIVIGVLRMESK